MAFHRRNMQRPVPSDAAKISMKSLFSDADTYGASDLLITAGSPPVVRIDGKLYPLTTRNLTPAITEKLLMQLLSEHQQAILKEHLELDLSLSPVDNLRFRANFYYQKGALSGAFRLIQDQIPTLEALGAPDILAALANKPHGLILITGQTGSGKSTTMAAMIDLINQSRNCHIITIEDPIEYVHTNKMAVIDQREVHADTRSFANALKYVLRQDPDVILVGEMRDLETIGSAITAAETGHLVIATLHTNDAVQAIDRIIDVFPPHQHEQIRTQLSFSLLAIVAQQLIPHRNGNGRVLATEVLVKNMALANHIREAKTAQTRGLIEASRREGMITMDYRLKELYEAGLIDWHELVRRVSSHTFLNKVQRHDEDEYEED